MKQVYYEKINTILFLSKMLDPAAKKLNSAKNKNLFIIYI